MGEREQISRCAIALGSNLGDSLGTLEAAIQSLSDMNDLSVEACSHWYQTKAIGPPQPDYLNGCAILQTTLAPLALLELLLELEKKFGRERRERWGPRTLDLDLLLFDNLILDTPPLQIPHPRMIERAFVLIPLSEIAPDWVEPVSGKTVAQLAEEVDTLGVSQLGV